MMLHESPVSSDVKRKREGRGREGKMLWGTCHFAALKDFFFFSFFFVLVLIYLQLHIILAPVFDELTTSLTWPTLPI